MQAAQVIVYGRGDVPPSMEPMVVYRTTNLGELSKELQRRGKSGALLIILFFDESKDAFMLAASKATHPPATVVLAAEDGRLYGLQEVSRIERRRYKP